jgi:hypothetical protein
MIPERFRKAIYERHIAEMQIAEARAIYESTIFSPEQIIDELPRAKSSHMFLILDQPPDRNRIKHELTKEMIKRMREPFARAGLLQICRPRQRTDEEWVIEARETELYYRATKAAEQGLWWDGRAQTPHHPSTVKWWREYLASERISLMKIQKLERNDLTQPCFDGLDVDVTMARLRL